MRCKICNKEQAHTNYAPAYSPFWPQGTIDICYSCVDRMVDYTDLNQVDRLLQYCNMAFLPEEWRKLIKRENENIFKKYSNIYHEINYYKYDWSEQTKIFKELAEEGVINLELEELKPMVLRDLKLKWGDAASELDLIRMDRFYNKSLSEWNVTKETEKDLLRKIVRLSVMIDNGLANNKPDKEIISMYDKLFVQLGKTLSAKQDSGFNSLSQLVEFIERNGYKPQYYDGVPKDEIDMMMNDIQEYLRDLVSSEVNFEEMLERAIQTKTVRDKKEKGETETETEFVDWGDEDGESN